MEEHFATPNRSLSKRIPLGLLHEKISLSPAVSDSQKRGRSMLSQRPTKLHNRHLSRCMQSCTCRTPEICTMIASGCSSQYANRPRSPASPFTQDPKLFAAPCGSGFLGTTDPATLSDDRRLCSWTSTCRCPQSISTSLDSAGGSEIGSLSVLELGKGGGGRREHMGVEVGG